jgi:hypothetical protein
MNIYDPEFNEFMLELEASLEEKEYTRPPSMLNVDCLFEIAQDLFERRGQRIVKNPDIEVLKQIVDKIAAVISRTYVEKGDYSQLADDEALMLIRDILLQNNPKIINRNKKRRLPIF